MYSPTVSIIIPVYNRAHLIEKTLYSIKKQTYTLWECLVVDDGSTDDTIKVVQTFCNEDARFKLHHRPSEYPQGGNAARNYGLIKSQGKFVNWFDSDDLMDPHFIEYKLELLTKNANLDFVVSRSVKFYPDNTIDNTVYYEQNDTLKLDADYFIQEKVHWLTPDIMIKKCSIKDVLFDVSLLSGQEYNFIIRLLAFNLLQGVFLDKVLCFVRKHGTSIQEELALNAHLGYKRKYIVALRTFHAVYGNIKLDSKLFYLRRVFKLATPLLLKKTYPPNYTKFLYLYFKTKGLVSFSVLLLHSVLLFLGKESYSLSKKVNI